MGLGSWFQDNVVDPVKETISDPLDNLYSASSLILPGMFPSVESTALYGGGALLGGAGASVAGALSGGAQAESALDGLQSIGDILQGGSNLLGGGLGDLIAGFTAGDWQKDINEQQLKWAREQSDIQQESRRTAYQTAVKDMRKAGINPMLAYKQGGAAQPGSISAPQMGNPIQAGINSATQVRKSQNDRALAQASIINTIQMAQESVQRAKTYDPQIQINHKQLEVMAEQIDKAKQEIANLKQTNKTQQMANAIEEVVVERILENKTLQNGLIATRLNPSAAGTFTVAASETLVNNAVKNGRITQEQAKRIKENAANRVANRKRRRGK